MRPLEKPLNPKPAAIGVALSRLLNLLLWLAFSLLAGTGLLLALKLPPGSRGGRGLTVLSWDRHEWGDLHTWISWLFLAFVILHLALHWRWLWKIAARRSSIPLALGVGLGILCIAAPVVLPVEKRPRGGSGADFSKTSGPHGGHGRGPEARKPDASHRHSIQRHRP